MPAMCQVLRSFPTALFENTWRFFNSNNFWYFYINIFHPNILYMHQNTFPAFQPRWKHRETHCASSQQPKEGQQQFKNKKQPELTESLIENQTTWKPNNQGDKEETFTQTRRRGRDGQPGQRRLPDPEKWQIVEWMGQAVQLLADPTAPHSRTDKPVGMARERSRQHKPGLQHGEIKPQTSDCKHPWGLRRQQEKLLPSQEKSLERPTGA